jgi:hypothetical protein
VLRTLIAGADDDPEIRGSYFLDATELAAIAACFDVAFDPGPRQVCLERPHSIRDVPYLIHTGFELPLMLEGRKPFARMGDAYPPYSHFGEEHFDPYVAQGLIHKEVDLEPFAKPMTGNDGRVYDGLRTVFYVLPGEAWRISAWKLIWSASCKTGWNEHFERLEGMLLGYEEWQNDWWIARYHTRSSPSG